MKRMLVLAIWVLGGSGLLAADETPAEEESSPFRHEAVKRVECGNISNAVLRGAHYFGTNEVIYRVSIGWTETPGEFVRLGDYIGDFQIVTNAGRRGREALVLRRNGEQFVLERSFRYLAPTRSRRR